jgi:hypothetical protein
MKKTNGMFLAEVAEIVGVPADEVVFVARSRKPSSFVDAEVAEGDRISELVYDCLVDIDAMPQGKAFWRRVVGNADAGDCRCDADGLRRFREACDEDRRWLATELSMFCCACGRRSDKAVLYYMVRDDVWYSVGNKSKKGIMCLGCLADRLGRPLEAADFTDVPLNDRITVRVVNSLNEKWRGGR